MDVRVGLWRRLSAEELMLLNCGVGEDSWESLGLQGDPTCPFWRRSALHQRVFFGRNDVKAETPVRWPPHAKSLLIGKDSDAGRHWGQEEKGMTEDEMAGWHHWLDGRESEWTPGVGVGQGGLGCCDSWGRKESDTTERLNWTDVSLIVGMSFLRKFIFTFRAQSLWQPFSELIAALSKSFALHQSNTSYQLRSLISVWWTWKPDVHTLGIAQRKAHTSSLL